MIKAVVVPVIWSGAPVSIIQCFLKLDQDIRDSLELPRSATEATVVKEDGDSDPAFVLFD